CIAREVGRTSYRFETRYHLNGTRIMVIVLRIPATDAGILNRHIHISECTCCPQRIHLVFHDVTKGDGVPVTRRRVGTETVLPIVRDAALFFRHVVLMRDKNLYVRFVFGGADSGWRPRTR